MFNERILLTSHFAGWEAEAQKGWEVGQVKVLVQRRAQDRVTMAQNACSMSIANVITTHLTTFSASAHKVVAHEIPMISFLPNKPLGPPVFGLILFFPKSLDNQLPP